MSDLSFVEELARAFSDRDARAADDAYPADNVGDLIDQRLLGAPFSEQHGGHGWNLATATRALEIVASGSPSTALLWAMPLGLAGALAIDPSAVPEEHRATWTDQMSRVAAEYAKGRIYGACNSEKGTGGSLDNLRTTAEKVDGVFELTGEKILASYGTHADYFFSMAKVSADDLPGASVAEFFLLRADAEGVDIQSDWDGFGMRSTESHTVYLKSAKTEELLGFPKVVEILQPLTYWYVLFTAIPLGCASGILEALSASPPPSQAVRARLTEARMRVESLRAYLLETARQWRPAAGDAYAARVLRTKTYVSDQSTKLCAELFALGGGRHYRSRDRLAGLLRDSFAGTALRPPLSLSLDVLSQPPAPPQ